MSVWVEICKWLHGVLFSNRHAPRERVSWNSLTVWFLFLLDSHAPRERVSWNKELSMWVNKLMVTLHVSVWVEMSLCLLILLCWTSRSTWACELKYTLRKFYRLNVGHAPRERVSWNFHHRSFHCTPSVTLHVSVWVEIRRHFLQNFLTKVTLHVSVWVEILVIRTSCKTAVVTLHVSVWVEMILITALGLFFCGHAPRERVSWNVCWPKNCLICTVTLHVSVWVEM